MLPATYHMRPFTPREIGHGNPPSGQEGRLVRDCEGCVCVCVCVCESL